MRYRQHSQRAIRDTLTVAADDRAKVGLMPMVRRPPGGGWAVVAFALAIVVVAVAVAAYHPSIDYGADPRVGALRAFANGDGRYLAIDGEAFTMGEEPIDPVRDLRRVRRASDASVAAQLMYIARYNETMRTIARGRAHGLPPQRPRPMPRPLFALGVVLVAAPFILMQYLRYRLGAYRRDGRAWTVDFWNPTRYLLRGTYTDEGEALLRALWAVMALTVPWVLLIVLGVFGAAGPLE